MYKGDIGYIKESADSDAIVILVAPHWLPYDLPEESGESVRFNVELARMAGLDLMPILCPSGAKIGYSCNGQQFMHGLFWLTLPADTLEIVKLPHPNNIRFHMAAGIDPYFHNFGKSRMLLRFERGISGARKGHLPTWIGTNDLWWFGVMMMLLNAPFLPLLEDEALPGNVVQVHHGPYAGQTGIIKWISPDSKVWMFNCGRGKGKEDSEQDSTPSQSMVAMNTSDLCIKRVPSTLTLSKDKGYNIAVGDMVEVARGQWCHSQGIVKAVDLIKASLDFMCLEDGIQINVPITFSHKVKEHFDYGLSKFIGHDVWVIGGDKKGT
ncbi:hypothetical protein EDD16DRAFT_1525033 [Pisolithus croceorrhizus]|nr:hypothetical protein EDD16DRAFT_1525033 [Pisolithus croceorrhizus]